MRSTPGRINQACLDLFNETAEVAVPRLMAELKKPHRVAARLDVGLNAVREWLLRRGWVCRDSEWIAPTVEAEHAPSV